MMVTKDHSHDSQASYIEQMHEVKIIHERLNEE